MDPKSINTIRDHVEQTNLKALEQYAKLLVRVGVQQPKVFKVFMMQN